MLDATSATTAFHQNHRTVQISTISGRLCAASGVGRPLIFQIGAYPTLMANGRSILTHVLIFISRDWPAGKTAAHALAPAKNQEFSEPGVKNCKYIRMHNDNMTVPARIIGMIVDTLSQVAGGS
jgi:hypothetical protein